MSKMKDYAIQTEYLALNKAEAQREMEIAELEWTLKTSAWRLAALIGRAKAVKFVRDEFTSSKIAF